MAGNVNITVSERAGKTCASSGSAWEPKLGYSRAVRKGNFIAVTGTVGVNADGTFAPTVAEQTRRSLEIIEAALVALGASLNDVIRTRMFVADVSQWQEVASVHGAVFGEIRPATSIVEVARLIDDAALIEIEVDAMV